MHVGVDYYPEHWPQDRWEMDASLMERAGFTVTRLSEFAWAFMEPTEGNFDFAWLDKNIELAADQCLKVVLCTPTPAPPVWLTEKHPEVLMVDAAGRTQVHGTRQHATWSSSVYRDYVERIVNDVHALVGTHLQTLTDALERLFRSHAEHRDSAGVGAAKFFLDL